MRRDGSSVGHLRMKRGRVEVIMMLAPKRTVRAVCYVILMAAGVVFAVLMFSVRDCGMYRWRGRAATQTYLHELLVGSGTVRVTHAVRKIGVANDVVIETRLDADELRQVADRLVVQEIQCKNGVPAVDPIDTVSLISVEGARRSATARWPDNFVLSNAKGGSISVVVGSECIKTLWHVLKKVAPDESKGH